RFEEGLVLHDRIVDLAFQKIDSRFHHELRLGWRSKEGHIAGQILEKKTPCIEHQKCVIIQTRREAEVGLSSCCKIRSYVGSKEGGKETRWQPEEGCCATGTDRGKRSLLDVRKRHLGRACFPR